MLSLKKQSFGVYKIAIAVMFTLALLLPLGLVTLANGNFVQSNAQSSTRATLAQNGHYVTNLDSTWMYSSDKEDLWHTGRDGVRFAGDTTVQFAPVNDWADVKPWSSSALNYVGGQKVVYNGMLYEATSWTANTPEGDGWVLLSATPEVTHTFTFDKLSDEQLMDYLDSERTRIMSKKKIFSYLPSWGVYSGREFFNVDTDIDYSAVTHVTYSFVKPIDVDKRDDAEKPITPDDQQTDNITDETTNFGVRFDDTDAALYVGGDWNAGGDLLNRIQKNLNQDPNLEQYFVFSLGGWTYSENEEFEKATSTPERLDQFAQSIVDFMVKWGFDGIDIDWEFPLTEQAAQQYLDLHRVLREKMTEVSMRTEKYYQLSTATTPNIDNIKYIKPKQLVQYVDTVNYMAYDYNGGSFSIDSPAAHNAPLYEPSKPGQEDNFWIDVVVQEYLKDVPANQLLMGVAYYARSWVGVEKGDDEDLPALGQKGSVLPNVDPGGTGGLFGNGTNPYYRMEDLLDKTVEVTGFANDYERYWDPMAQVPYLYSQTDKIFHTYDDAESIGIKIDYIQELGLAGTIVWDLTDDTRPAREDGTPAKGTSEPFVLSKVVKRLVNVSNINEDDALVTTSILSNAKAGVDYSSNDQTQLKAIGKGTIVFSLDSTVGANPTWLKVSTNGQLSGIPTQEQSNVIITVIAKGDTGVEHKKVFTIIVLAADPVVPGPSDPGPNEPDKKTTSDNNGNIIAVVAIVVGVCAIVSIAAGVIINRNKKSKKNIM